MRRIGFIAAVALVPLLYGLVGTGFGLVIGWFGDTVGGYIGLSLPERNAFSLGIGFLLVWAILSIQVARSMR